MLTNNQSITVVKLHIILEMFSTMFIMSTLIFCKICLCQANGKMTKTCEDFTSF